MYPQVLSFDELVSHFTTGVMTDEQIEFLFGAETKNRILEHLQTTQYAGHYA